MSAARTPARQKSAKPALTLVPGADPVEAAPVEAAPVPAPLTGAARVKALIAEAEAGAAEMVAAYADDLRQMAVKAREVAALDKHAPSGVVQNATLMAEKLDAEASAIDAIRNRR